MNGRWEGHRAARLPARVELRDDLDVVPDDAGAGADVMDSVPGEVKSRYAVAGLVVAAVSFAAGFSFGRHRRHR